MVKLSENFSDQDLMCKCGCGKVLAPSELLTALEHLEEYCVVPIKISSGTRCKEHNKAVGGSPNSSHLKGLAVDIKCPTMKARYALLWAIFTTNEFTRIGIGKNFIHVDLDPDKKSEIVWTY